MSYHSWASPFFLVVGFANDPGGFEVCSPNFKGTLDTKDICFLPLQGSPRAAVFEGFFDFLSVLAHYRKDRAEANVLVLNSIAMLPRGMEHLQAAQVTKLYAYLDHDAAGEKGLATLQAAQGWRVLDASGLYAGFKDANAARSRQHGQRHQKTDRELD